MTQRAGDDVPELCAGACFVKIADKPFVLIPNQVDIVGSVKVRGCAVCCLRYAVQKDGVIPHVAGAFDILTRRKIAVVGRRSKDAHSGKTDRRRRDRAIGDQAAQNMSKAMEQNDVRNDERRAAAEYKAKREAAERAVEHAGGAEDHAGHHAGDKGHQHLHRVAGQTVGKARLRTFRLSAPQQEHAQHKAAEGEQEPVDRVHAVICRHGIECVHNEAMACLLKRRRVEERLYHALDKRSRKGIAKADRQKAEHRVDGAAAADSQQSVERDTGDRAERNAEKQPQYFAVHRLTRAGGDDTDDADKHQRRHHRRRKRRQRLGDKQHARFDGQRIDPVRLALAVQIGKHAQCVDDRKNAGEEEHRQRRVGRKALDRVDPVHLIKAVDRACVHCRQREYCRAEKH